MCAKELTGYPSIDKPWLKYYREDFLSEPLPAMNIYSYLKSMTAGYSDLTAISYFGLEISYNQLMEQIDTAAKVLIKLGVKPGERVMYLMPNIPETAYLLYGSARLGAVADFVDPRPDSVDFTVSAKKILALIQEEGVKHLVVLDQCYFAMIQPVENELAKVGIRSVLLVSASTSMTAKTSFNYLIEKWKFEGFSAILEVKRSLNQLEKQIRDAEKSSPLELLNYKSLSEMSEHILLPEISYSSNALAVIVHTSGTTSSKPKPIPLTHDNLNIYVHQTFAANMPIKAGDRQLHILPYFAAFGVVCVAHGCLCHGTNLIQVPEFSPDNLGKLIIRYQPQMIIGTPSWFLGLLHDSTLKKSDLSCLSMVTYGGDGMDAADEIRVNSFLSTHNAKCVLTKGHGMSETCGCASYATNSYNIPDSIGIPLPLTTYAIVDADTKELLKFDDSSQFLEGELIISSGSVTPGILDGRIIVPHKEYNGETYILTRDIVRMNRDGIIKFLARSDRSFTRFDGFKIKPYEIETVIKAYPSVEHCAITPVYDDKKFGNLAVANIVTAIPTPTHKDKVNLAEAIIDSCFIHNPNVSTRQIPAYIVFHDSFPITKNSKTDFVSLARNAMELDKVCISFSETNIAVSNLLIK